MQRILYFLLLLSVTACQKAPRSTDRHSVAMDNYDELPPKLKYLALLSNYDSTATYQDHFKASYSHYLQAGQIDSAGYCLTLYGYVLKQAGIVDTLFLSMAQEYIKTYEKNNDSKVQSKIATIAANIGVQYSNQGDPDLGNQWLKKALANPAIPEATKANACLSLGLNLLRAHNMDSSLVYIMHYTTYAEQHQDTRAMAVGYMNLALYYKLNNANSEFEKYNQKAYHVLALRKDSIMMSQCYYNSIVATASQTFDTLQLTARIDTFATLFSHCLSKNANHRYMLNSLLFHKYKFLKDADGCATYLQKIQQDKAVLNNHMINTDCKIYEFELNQLQKRPLTNIAELEALAKELEQTDRLTDAGMVYVALYDYAKNKKLLKSAYYLEQQLRVANLQENSVNKGKLFELEKKYQSQQKEKQILEQQAKIQQAKIQISGLLFSILIILLAVFIYLGYKKQLQIKADAIRQQKFTDELLQNTEAERKRIATDLHDSISHELLTLKNKVYVGTSVGVHDLEKVINEVRQVSRDLYPAMFDNIGLAASIEALCERMTAAGLFTTCDINYTLKLTKRNELQLYRIIQEALNNTLKHAKADAAKITINTVGNELAIEIKDNGIGFNSTAKMNDATSFGIQSIFQRARAIGGKSSIESDANGTKLILKTPIH